MPRRDPFTLDIFAEPVSAAYGEDVTGRGPLSNRIARLYAHMLDCAADRSLTRADIAVKVGERLERVITKASLDKWASQSATDRQLPMDVFIATVEVTGDVKALGTLAALFGHALVSADCADWIELHRLDEQKRAIAARESALRARVRGPR